VRSRTTPRSSNRQVADQDVGAGFGEGLDDVDRLVGRLLDHGPVVLPEPVEGGPTADGHPEIAHVGEANGVVLPGEDGFPQVQSHLRRVHVEGGDGLDVADVIAAEHDVHQSRHRLSWLGAAVVLDALNERRRTVADADDGYSNRTHPGVLLQRCGGVVVVVVVVIWPVVHGSRAVARPLRTARSR